MEASAFRKHSVLVVDDQEKMQIIISKILKSIGFTDITIAADGASAIKEITAYLPDLILCDIVMLPVDGLTFLKTLRHQMELVHAQIPVIFLTANADLETVARAQKLCVDGILFKPVAPQKLKEKIIQVFASRQAPVG